MNPIEMSREVMAAISYTYDLESYSPSELRSLFDDWLSEIESLVLRFVNSQRQVDPDTIAVHLNLKRSTIIFILGKLAREGRISMHATGTKPDSITKIAGKGKIQKLRRKK
ncbi:MAG TPA: hypothetical protein ENK33_11385 [Desulfobacterales bacterium]|nr:hypothetical protein [Desulfobacterales bacterium]